MKLPLSSVFSLIALGAALGLSTGCSLSTPTHLDPDRAAASEKKWASEIAAFEAADQKTPPPADPVLFVGSSSIRLWDLEQSFPDLTVMNRGFGGSTTPDALHFADRIITPYDPACIVIYEGDNDIAKDATPEQVIQDFKSLVKRIRLTLPDTPIIYVAIKPSIKRWDMWPDMKAANDGIAAFCAGRPNLHYADIAAPMLALGSPPPASLFKADGLHLSPEGYAVWTSVVRPLIDQSLAEQ